MSEAGGGSGASRGRRRTPTSGPREAPQPEGLDAPSTDAVAGALRELAALIPTSGTVADAQKSQLVVLQALLSAKSAFALEPHLERPELKVVAVRGRNDERILATPPGEGPGGQAFSRGGVVRAEGVLALPVLGAKGPLGAVVLLQPRLSLPDGLALTVGQQLGAAWEFARLKDDALRRNKDLQTAIAGLKSLERNREELLSNVSHDLKNPLTTVKAYLAMLGQGKLGPLSEKQGGAVQVAERNADRLQKMVNDLLLISRLQSGKMQLDERPFGLKAMASEVLQTLAPVADQARVQLVLEKCPEAFVKGDRERLSEAVQHLAEYAIHQSPSGSTVRVALAAADGLVALTVQDNGPELAPEQLEHLFDSFHRARTAQGLRTADVGLSLPIVAKIIKLHGGKVEAESDGTGSRVRLYLPAFAAAVSAVGPAAAPRQGDILLVEDDQDCREVLQEVLEAEGYSVMATWNVEEARRLLGQSPPALVLLDLRLSHEDGRSVLHHIRSTPALASTAVYLISGASEVGSLAAGTGLDRIEGFFEKPLQLGRLLDTVASVVHPGKGLREVPRPEA